MVGLPVLDTAVGRAHSISLARVGAAALHDRIAPYRASNSVLLEPAPAYQTRQNNQRRAGRTSPVTDNAIRCPIEGIWRDWLQSVEKTRDATSSSSVEVGGEMSNEFAGLDTCDSHMTKKWREDRAAPGVPCSGQTGNAGRLRCCMRSTPNRKCNPSARTTSSC